MTAVQHDASKSPVGAHLVSYLRLATDAAWELSHAASERSFPLIGQDGQAMGHLCMSYDGEPSRYDALARAVAAAIVTIVEAEATTAGGTDTTDSVGAAADSVADGRMIAYFQPIVQLATGDVVAIEALARMQTADGVLGPESFLETYSTGPAMLHLFDAMLDETLRFLAEFRHRMPDLSAAINLEFAGIPDRGLAELISSRLERSHVAADALSIELNERVAYELSDAAVAELGRVVDLGVKLLIDDVPSSFRALDRLGGLEVSGAKLDRRHVKMLAGSAADRAEVADVVARAGERGIELIAEGVETQALCDELVRLGCSFGQGYLFAVPQPASTLAALLEAPLVASW